MLLLDNLIHRVFAGVQLQNVLFTGKNLARVMGYVQHCSCAAITYKFHQMKDFAAVVFVQAVARLIQNQDFRGFYCGTQDQNGPLFTVTKVSKVF